MPEDDSPTAHLYLAEFCPHSQRPMVALLEMNIPFEHTVVPEQPPKWLFDISPQGALPVLKLGDDVVVGSDAVCAYLEKFPKVEKLFLSKKKNYHSAIIHCKTKLEPAVDKFFDSPYPEASLAPLKEMLFRELQVLNNSIRGPFYFGSSISWVDIDYWTYVERIALLKHLYKIEIPESNKTLLMWLERLNKREAFVKARYSLKDLIKWSESKRSSLSDPKVGAVRYTRVVNSALREGARELLQSANNLDFAKVESVETLRDQFESYCSVLREHTLCKTTIFFPAVESKLCGVVNEILNSVRQGQAKLDAVTQLLNSASRTCTLQSELEKKKLLEEVKDEPDNLAKRREERRGALITILEWELEKIERETPSAEVKQQLIKALEANLQHLNKTLDIEETVLTYARMSSVFTKRELDHVIRRLAFISVEKDPKNTLVWVMRHLDDSQKDQFVFNLRCAKPYSFVNVTEWLKECLTEDEYRAIEPAVTASVIANDGLMAGRKSSVALTSDDADSGDKDERRRRTRPSGSSSSSSGAGGSSSSGSSQSRSRGKGSGTSSQRGKGSRAERSERREGDRRSDRSDRERSERSDKDKSDRSDRERSEKSERSDKDSRSDRSSRRDRKEHSRSSSTSQVPSSTPKPKKPETDPLRLLFMTFSVLRARLTNLETIAKARHRLHTLAPLEEAAAVLAYFSITNLHLETIVLPSIRRFGGVQYEQLVQVYTLDIDAFAERTKGIFVKLLRVQAKGEVAMTDESLDSLFEDIISQVVILKHHLWRQDVHVFPVLEESVPQEARTLVVRGMLDVSPASYFGQMVPWIIRFLPASDKAKFVGIIRDSITPAQFHNLSMGMRKNLPLQLSEDLLGSS